MAEGVSPKPNSLLCQGQPPSKVGSFYQRGFAGLSTGGGGTAQGVTSNTSPLNAALITPFPAASKPRNKRDNALSPNQGCQATTPPPTLLPTPVKVNRLAIYLTGYENKLQKNLIDGFTFVFRLHFQGPPKGLWCKKKIDFRIATPRGGGQQAN